MDPPSSKNGRFSRGAVTFLHEAGSALNVNPHPHSVVPDGVFAFEPEQPAIFVELPPPTQPELEVLLATIVRRVKRALERARTRDRDLDAELEDPLAQAQARAAQLRLERASSAESTQEPSSPLCARRAGFSLQAAVTVAAADKQGRLRLLRYGARAALCSHYLSILPDGRVRYQLRRSAGPGHTSALVLEPAELLHRLAAIQPRPYQHRTVYHGIFAPAASRRFKVSPAAAHPRRGPRRCAALPGPALTARTYTLETSHQNSAPLAVTAAPEPQRDAEAQAVARFCAPPPAPPGGRFPWAELIARTFPDALDCPNCGATLSVIAYITELAVVRKILEHLGLPSSPELTPARLPRELGFDFEPDDPSDGEPDGAEPPITAPPGPRASQAGQLAYRLTAPSILCRSRSDDESAHVHPATPCCPLGGLDPTLRPPQSAPQSSQPAPAIPRSPSGTRLIVLPVSMRDLWLAARQQALVQSSDWLGGRTACPRSSAG